MNDPVWEFLEALPGKSAALFDWDHALSGWDRYPLFRDHFLQLTKNHATAVDCPTDCGLGCPRKVVVHSDSEIVAVCQEKEAGAVPLVRQQTFIYRLKQSAVNKAICRALDIQHREEPIPILSHTWRLGDFLPSTGTVFPVYLTLPEKKDDMTETVRELCLENQNPFVLLAPTRKLLSRNAERLMNQRAALFMALCEEVTFQEGGRLKRIRNESPFRILFPDNHFAASTDPLPANIFRQCGDRWQIRFQGGESVPFERQKGVEYLTLLLAAPGRYISVLDLYHGGTLDEETRKALESSGLEVGDYQAAAEIRNELNRIDQEIESSRECSDLSRLDDLHENREMLLSQVKAMIGPGGKLRHANDPLRKPRDNVSKAVRRTLKNLKDARMTALAEHLESSLEFGGEMRYQPSESISWETKPVIG